MLGRRTETALTLLSMVIGPWGTVADVVEFCDEAGNMLIPLLLSEEEEEEDVVETERPSVGRGTSLEWEVGSGLR
jgi:hypothetical protein